MLITKKARIFATDAHRGQVRKYTGEPYILHPLRVAGMVFVAEELPEEIAAALLHDVVEDTDVTFKDIDRHFGPHVTNLVKWLTNISTPANGDRADRKQIDRDFLAAAPPAAKTIKLADIIDNTKSICLHDPKFAVTYMAEKKALLKVLTEGNADLFNEASSFIKSYYDGMKGGPGTETEPDK